MEQNQNGSKAYLISIVMVAVVGGGLDYLETKIIAERAYKWFFENNFDEKNSNIETKRLQN